MPEEGSSPASPADTLANEIINGAEKRAKRLKARAADQAKSIIKNAQREAKRILDDAIAGATKRAEQDARRIRATISTEERAIELSARQTAIDAAFDIAKQQLASADVGPEALADLCIAAIGVMPGDKFTLALAGKDLPTAPAVVSAVIARLGKDGRNVTIEAQAEPANTAGGVIVATPDGRMVFNNSFDARLDRARDELRTQVAGIIFAS